MSADDAKTDPPGEGDGASPPDDASKTEVAAGEAADAAASEQATAEVAAGEAHTTPPTDASPTDASPTDASPTDASPDGASPTEVAGEASADAQDAATASEPDPSVDEPSPASETAKPEDALSEPVEDRRVVPPPASGAPEEDDSVGEPPLTAPVTGKGLVALLSSYGLSVVLLLLLLLLTYVGTLEQVDEGLYDVQQKYFNSLFLVHWVGPIPVPLPGVALILALLTVNLVFGGVIRLRPNRAEVLEAAAHVAIVLGVAAALSSILASFLLGIALATGLRVASAKGVLTLKLRKVGVLLVHAGILLMVAAGAVTLFVSEDGQITLFEGERAHAFTSYYEWELALAPLTADGFLKAGTEELVIPGDAFASAHPTTPFTFHHERLPFELRVTRFLRNCEPKDAQPKGQTFPGVDGFWLEGLPKQEEAEANIAGVYLEILAPNAAPLPELAWGVRTPPLVVPTEAGLWRIRLRRKTRSLPFSIHLDDFHHEYYPGTRRAKKFESTVTKREAGADQQVLISMNQPLRHRGYTFFQASWGPPNAEPGTRLFSTLAVVRNPADQWPLYSCLVIAIGLVIHFGVKLLGYIRSQQRKRSA